MLLVRAANRVSIVGQSRKASWTEGQTKIKRTCLPDSHEPMTLLCHHLLSDSGIARGARVCFLGRWGSNIWRVIRFILSLHTQHKQKKILETTAGSWQQCLPCDCETAQQGLLCLIIQLVFRKHNWRNKEVLFRIVRTDSAAVARAWVKMNGWVRWVLCGLGLETVSSPLAPLLTQYLSVLSASHHHNPF